jgi:small subunit ribosomal protein S16
MAVKIRLRRMGSRNAAFYRVIVQDGRYAPTGRFIETLGWYDPKQEGNNFSLNLDRVDYWLGNGAQPSDTANSLIVKARVLPVETAVSGSVTEEEVPVAAVEAEEAAEAAAAEAPAAEEVAETAAEAPAVKEAAATEEVVAEVAEEAPIAEEATESASVEAAADKEKA